MRRRGRARGNSRTRRECRSPRPARTPAAASGGDCADCCRSNGKTTRATTSAVPTKAIQRSMCAQSGICAHSSSAASPPSCAVASGVRTIFRASCRDSACRTRPARVSAARRCPAPCPRASAVPGSRNANARVSRSAASTQAVRRDNRISSSSAGGSSAQSRSMAPPPAPPSNCLVYQPRAARDRFPRDAVVRDRRARSRAGPPSSASAARAARCGSMPRPARAATAAARFRAPDRRMPVSGKCT